MSKPIVIGGKLKLKGSSSSSISKTSNGFDKKRVADGHADLAAAAPFKIQKNEVSSSDNQSTLSSLSKSSVGTKCNIEDDKLNSFLTESQRRHKRKKIEQEARAAKSTASSYRDRIEEFNYKLSVTTEHNDIPRISAAGNG